jgi:cysteine desulfurase
VGELGIDMLTMNGAKINGPKGIGILYKKEFLELKPLIVGGSQEYGLRAGTENLPQIVGMTMALVNAQKNYQKEYKRYWELRKYFTNKLKNKIKGIIINGHPEKVLPNIVHVTVANIEGESMVLLLDEKGVEVSTGSACSTQDLQPSHVLVAIGQDDDLVHGSLRFSFGRDNSKKDLDYVLSVFPTIVEKLEKISALTMNSKK